MTGQTQVTVEFTCYSCDEENRATVTVSDDNDVSSLNFRKRTVQVACKSCGKTNTVDVDA